MSSESERPKVFIILFWFDQNQKDIVGVFETQSQAEKYIGEEIKMHENFNVEVERSDYEIEEWEIHR